MYLIPSTKLTKYNKKHEDFRSTQNFNKLNGITLNPKEISENKKLLKSSSSGGYSQIDSTLDQ